MNINPCKGCFSDMETRCHYLCDCYDDDFPGIARKIIDADGVIFASPTYMFGMSSTLKRFFERWISFKAPPVDRERAFIYHTGHSMQSMEDVRNGFYENQWLLNALENLACSIVDLIQPTQGHEWPGMPDVLFKTGKSSAR